MVYSINQVKKTSALIFPEKKNKAPDELLVRKNFYLFKMNLPPKLAPYGALFIRLLVGFHLIYGTQDNVFSYERMLEFKDFLEARGVPLPLVAAHVSVYAQFIAGVLYIIGWQVRGAALVMVINFIAAIVIVHLGESYPGVFPALVMLFSSLFLLLYGAGKPSLDQGL